MNCPPEEAPMDCLKIDRVQINVHKNRGPISSETTAPIAVGYAGVTPRGESGRSDCDGFLCE